MGELKHKTLMKLLVLPFANSLILSSSPCMASSGVKSVKQSQT